MLKDPSTYESIDPAPLGRQHQYLLGKHSGRGLVETLLASEGIKAAPEVVLRILERVKLAKSSRDKSSFLDMDESLRQFWGRHLSFGEDQFWEIAREELAKN